MRRASKATPVLYVSFALACAITASLQAAESPRTIGSVERLDPALDKLVPADTKMEIVGEGYTWSEGPVWVKQANFLLFSDIPNNRIMKWDAKNGVTEYLKPAGFTGEPARGGESGSNGLAIDQKGRLVLCQHGDRRVAWLDAPWDAPRPNFVTLADRYDGKRFSSPNDAIVHSSGAVYFTDPPYGLEKGMDDPTKELEYQGIYRIVPNGTVTLLSKELERPNGIAFSPDEKTLYVANSHGPRPIIMAFPVKEDGTLGKGREFFNANTLKNKKELQGSCDGLTVDKHGNLFATTPGGVTIFSPDGKRLGTLLTEKRTSNCEFGEDGSTLFITADDLLLRVPLSTTGIGF